jgi:hypothetical protein
MVTPRPAKSFTLRVTMVRSCSSAVAAIMPSGAPRASQTTVASHQAYPIAPQSPALQAKHAVETEAPDGVRATL